ncbi:MAG: hypothetical protein JW730_11895 [Anaerolineales bacterium]|nr:hypothetical protein [Anaerolineales bacterium]
MIRLLETSTFYVVSAIAIYLMCKAFIIRTIWNQVTVCKTRNILLVLAILFSPTLSTIAWFMNSFDAAFYICVIPGAAVVVDWGIVRWVRAIFEPLETLDDLEYDPDITNVDIP